MKMSTAERTGLCPRSGHRTHSACRTGCVPLGACSCAQVRYLYNGVVTALALPWERCCKLDFVLGGPRRCLTG